MKTFKELGLHEDILQSIKKIGFYEPTEIQEASIPLILAGNDVIAGSSTGSGKTFAFGAGIIQRLTPGRGVQALIQVPTRELAEQLLQTFNQFCKQSGIRVIAVYGGVSLNPQIIGLKSADIVIGTPGRTLDHLERGTLRLHQVKHVVLDEADRMLDMGFLPDIERILEQCPTQRQTLLFSATISDEISFLAQQFMRSPKRINLEEYVDPQKLTQETIFVPGNKKLQVLCELIKNEDSHELMIVFTNTRRETDRVARVLKQEMIKAAPIHGGLSQNQRLKVIKLFNSKNNLNVLVCTDVASRGLDIPGVSHVYNYDMPNEPKQYVHRIGRTARAGADGKAVNLVNKKDRWNYGAILHENGLNIPEGEMPDLSSAPKPHFTAPEPKKRGRFPKRSEMRRPKSRRGSREDSKESSGAFKKRPVKKSFSRGRRFSGPKRSFRSPRVRR